MNHGETSMKKGIVFLSLFALWACKDAVQTAVEKPNDKIESVTIEEVKAPAIKTIFEKEEKKLLDLLLPMYYDKDFHEEEVKQMNDSWLALLVEGGKFKVQRIKYEQIEMENECTGSDAIGVFPTEEEVEPLFFFSDSKAILKGKKESLPIQTKPLWPGEPQTYVFKDRTYVLRAEGKEVDSYVYTDDSEAEKTYKKIDNYKLYVSVEGGNEQLILDIPSFNDTFVQLLFVGDLDGDGKLDFIFDTSAHYEQKQVEVYLSRGAKYLLYLAGMTSVDFSC